MSLSTVHILLATYNGEIDVVLHLADDGSIGGIMALLR
jgi:hypothetical protein